jgi:hypothetical protein
VTLADLDSALARLQSAAEQVGANLLELDRDPTRQLLDDAVLEGTSASSWGDAATSSADLWSWYSQLTALLDAAKTLRGARPWLAAEKESALHDLLEGPSIELARTEVPIHDRDLFTPRQSTTHCTPDELLELMRASFDRIRSFVGSTAHAWNDLVPRVATARLTLDGIAAEPQDLDTEMAPELARLRSRLDRLGRSLMGDPLSVEASDIDTLEQEIEHLQAGLVAAAAFRDGFRAYLDGAQSLLEELRAATAAALQARAETTAKIAVPSVSEPEATDQVADDLVTIEALAESGKWHAAQTELDSWTAGAEAAVRRAHAVAAANREPIEARNQLRGRLDAYEAMAGAFDLLEDADLARIHEEARRELYTAPTDLARAASLVQRYRQAFPNPTAATDVEEPR